MEDEGQCEETFSCIEGKQSVINKTSERLPFNKHWNKGIVR